MFRLESWARKSKKVSKLATGKGFVFYRLGKGEDGGLAVWPIVRVPIIAN